MSGMMTGCKVGAYAGKERLTVHQHPFGSQRQHADKTLGQAALHRRLTVLLLASPLRLLCNACIAALGALWLHWAPS